MSAPVIVAPRERPILFKAAMVRAVLDGLKTQTRRIARPQPPALEAVHKLAGIDFGWVPIKSKPGYFQAVGPIWAIRKAMGPDEPLVPDMRCPLGAPGDRLWVREAFCYYGAMDEHVGYRATDEEKLERDAYDRWRPSIHMPRWASRLTLAIKEVRLEPLQAISPNDARAEVGRAACPTHDFHSGWCTSRCPDQDAAQLALFRKVWEGVYGAESWAANPWVWAVTFQVVKGGQP